MSNMTFTGQFGTSWQQIQNVLNCRIDVIADFSFCAYSALIRKQPFAEENRHDKNKEAALVRCGHDCGAGLRGVCQPGSQGTGQGCHVNGTEHTAEAACQGADQCRVCHL